MKTKFVKQFLTAALAATLAFTSVVPAYAADNTELLNENSEENGNGDNTGDDAGLDASVETPANGDTTDNNNNDTVEQKDDTSANTDNAQNVPGEPADNDDADDQQNTDEQNQPADPEQAQEEENEEEESAPEEEEAAEIVGTAGSVDITFNYYITYDAEDPENQDNLFKSITKTMPLGLDPESRKAQETYVYPIVGTPTYSTFVFEFWADAPDTDLEADYNSVSYDERPNVISLGQYYQYPGSPLDPAQFAEEGKGTINLYAQWKKGDGDVIVVVHTGENGSIKDPYNYLTTLKVGMPLQFNYEYSDMSSFGVYPKNGYTIGGIYLDPDHETPFPKSTREFYSYEAYFITDEMVNADRKLDVYFDFIPITVSKITIYGFGNDKKVITGEFGVDETFPENMNVTIPEGEEFHGFWGNSAAKNGTGIEVIPGVTKISDVRYYKHYNSNADFSYNYEIDLSTHWRDARTYKVTYHLNLGNSDVKQEFDYTASDRTTSMDLSQGALSENSAFPKDAGVFLGWATKDGKKEFGRAETVGTVINYMRNNKLSSLDIYAQWDKGTYTVEFNAGADWDEEYSFAGSEMTDGDTETVSIGESYILSGKEFVRKGYTLDHWNVTGGKVTTLKPTQTFKDIAAEGGKATLTAVWKKQTYTIKLNTNGGTLASGTNTIKYDAETAHIAAGIALPEVTKTGYNFDGWFEGATRYEEYGKDLYKNLNLTAKWSVNTYDLKLDAMGGTVKGKEEELIEGIAYDKTVNLGSYKATKPGYTFVSWKRKDAETIYKATQKVSKLTTENETVTLEAQWKANTYKITYNYDGGKLPDDAEANPATYEFGAKVEDSNITAPEKTGYTFGGYTVIRKGAENITLDEVGEKWSVVGPVTLKAIWLPDLYQVKITADFGDEDPVEGKYPKSKDPKTESYYDYTQTLNFHYVLREMDKDKSHNIKGLAFTQDATESKYANNEPIKVADLVKEAKEAGAIDEKGANGRIKGVINLYGVIDDSPKTHYITYDYLSEAKISKFSTSYKTGTAVTLPKLTLTGRKFIGWVAVDSDGNAIEDDENLVYYDYPTGKGKDGEDHFIKVVTGIKKTASANYTFRASFIINSYAVKVMPNGKDVKQGDKNATAEFLTNSYMFVGNDSPYLETPLPTVNEVLASYQDKWTRTGYTLVGFGTKAGAKEKDAIKTFDRLTTGSTATLYAIWRADKATVTYQNSYVLYENAWPTENSGYSVLCDDFSGTEEQVYGKALSLKKLSVPGYTFVGWKQASGSENGLSLSKDKKYVTGIKKDNTEDHEFYAVFTVNTYNIKLNTQGGTMYNPIGTKNRYFKGTQVIVKNKAYSDNVYESEIVSRYSLPTKKGYNFVGIATDAKGKNLIIDAEGYAIPIGDHQYTITAKNRGFAVKNKGTITLYAIWEKVDGIKVTGVKAGYSYKNNALSVEAVTDIEDLEDVRFEIQYSTNVLFTKNSTTTTIVTGNDSTVLNPRSGSNFYVKVRAGRKDSSGNYVYGKWSSTVRASKTAE